MAEESEKKTTDAAKRQSDVATATEKPTRRGRKPGTGGVAPEESDNRVEGLAVEPLFLTQQVDPDSYEGSEVSSLGIKPSYHEDDARRIVERGEDIDVNVDENGVAQETVFQEIPLMGTDATSLRLVAAKGTYYKKK